MDADPAAADPGRPDDGAILDLAIKAGLITVEDARAAADAAPDAAVAWLVERQRLVADEVEHLSKLLTTAARRRMQETLPPMLPAGARRTPPTLHGEGTGRPDSGVLAMPERIGPYAIEAVLGQGAMGTVYRAHRPDLGRRYALKVLRADVLSPAVVTRFRREAQAAGTLAAHPAIVGVHDVGTADGRTYFAMDLIDGPTLDRVIQSGDMSPNRAARILETVARGVHYAHTEGILHRDLKPGNIMLDDADHPHIVDFGLATRREADEAAARLTRTGELIGTPAYMAPEQVANTAVDVRADVYALGATLYDALCGQPPFVGPTSYEVLRQVTTAEVVPVRQRNPTVPAALDTIARKCLYKEPARRYQTAEALADDLARFQRGDAILARRESFVQRGARRVRRNPAPWLALGAVGVVLLAVTAVWLWGRLEARSAVRKELQLARAVSASDPERALGILQSLHARAPELPGLADALRDATARRAALAVEGLRAQAATLLRNGREAVAAHKRVHDEWQELQRAEDAALTRELDGAKSGHDPDQAVRRARLAQLRIARDDAYAAAQAAFGGATQVLAGHPDAPEYQEAAAAAADLAWVRLQAAEARYDRMAAPRFAADLARQGAATHAREIDGAGTLTLATVPAGAAVECRRYVEQDGMLVAQPFKSLGTTPLRATPVPMGSYLLLLTRAGFAPVRYAVKIDRLEDHVVRTPIRLLTAAQIGDGFVYVPGGYSVVGNDGKARTAYPPRRVWVEAFCIGRDEVTVGEYAEFLDALLAAGLSAEEVQARAPRQNRLSDFLWVVRDGRILRHRLQADPAVAVGGVSWDDAMAYAAWRSRRDGRTYRLPTGLEWQRAGRGADGRSYPWGNTFGWEHTVGGRWPGHDPEAHWAQPAGAAPDDESPFGVRDLGGNLEEWTDDAWNGGNSRGRRGGCWGLGGLIDFHLANHGTTGRTDVNLTRGFRLRCDVPKE